MTKSNYKANNFESKISDITSEEKKSGAGWDFAEGIKASIKRVEIPSIKVSVLDFGACPDGEKNNYQAFRDAIIYCYEKGGGSIQVPKGTYLCNGPIHLKSNVNLHLEHSETCILFGTNMEDYLVGEDRYKGCVLTSWEGTRLYNYSPAIYAFGQKNISITGKGTIDQQATDTWHQWRHQQKEDQQLSRQMNNDGIPVEQRIFGAGHYLRPQMIQFYQCQQILIQGVTLKNAGFWMIHPLYSQHVIVEDVKFNSQNINNDGVDPESCEYVWIKGIKFCNGDDNIAIKSGRDLEGLTQNKSSSKILVEDCAFNAYNAMAIGSEISGGVNHIYVQNCTYDGEVRSGLYIKTNLDRGGITEHIYMRNLTFGNAKAGIRMITNYKKDSTYKRIPSIRDIVIEDVSFKEIETTVIELEGLEEMPLQNIKIINVTSSGSEQVKIAHVKDLDLRNLRINGNQINKCDI